MRVRCLLRDIRGPRTMTAVAKAAGINLGALSRIEQGVAFPKDEQIPALEAAYGAMVTDWYPPIVLLAIEMEDSKRDELRDRMHVRLADPLTLNTTPFYCDSCGQWIGQGSAGHLDNCPRNYYAGKGYGATGGNYAPPVRPTP